MNSIIKRDRQCAKLDMTLHLAAGPDNGVRRLGRKRDPTLGMSASVRRLTIQGRRPAFKACRAGLLLGSLKRTCRVTRNVQKTNENHAF